MAAFRPSMSKSGAIEVPSTLFGTYRIKRRLGEGGMSEVFLAEAVDGHGDQVKVALKMMKKGIDESFFAQEADLMGLLGHPNLVRMLELGQAYGRYYIAMEFLVGGDLREVMEAHQKQLKGVPPEMAVHIVIELLKGLAYFHKATTRTGTPLNLVHSDVNPSNIFFSGDGEVKLGDFGVAATAATLAQGVAAGKLSYLSPEQTRGETVTSAADLWSAAVTLYELVVGYHPFRVEGLNEQQVMQAIRAAKVALPDYVDKPLAAVLAKALSPDPKNRFRTAGEFAGPLLTWALDTGKAPSRQQVAEWLSHTLGLVV
jgi:serine/threonine protein kinase